MPEASVERAYLDACSAAQRAREAAEKEEQERRIRDAERIAEEQKKAAEAQKHIARRTQVGAVLFVLLAISIVFAQNINSRFYELNALNESSSYLFVENRRLDALVESVRAGQLQTNINWWQRYVPGFELIFRQATAIRIKTIGTLQQTVYGTHEHNRLESHSEKVNSVSYHTKGQMLASGSDDGTIRLWKSDGELIKTINADEKVTTIAFSPVRAVLASACADGTVQLWDPVNGIPLRRWQGHQGGLKTSWITDIRFSPTGEVLATASRDETIKLWNAADGTLLKEFKGHKGWVDGVSFSPDGRTLASAGEDGTVRLWNVKEGTQMPLLPAAKRVTNVQSRL